MISQKIKNPYARTSFTHVIGKHCHVKLDIIGQQSILEPKTPKTPKMTKQAHFDKYFSKKSKTHVPCSFWRGTQNWSWYEIEQWEWKCKGRPSVQSPTNPAVWTVQALWCLTNVYTLDDKNSGLTPLTQALRDRDPWEQVCWSFESKDQKRRWIIEFKIHIFSMIDTCTSWVELCRQKYHLRKQCQSCLCHGKVLVLQ